MLSDEMMKCVTKESQRMGRDAGQNAAEWWAQDAVGGRNTNTRRDIAKGAQALLEDFPIGWPDAPNLSGEWADSMTPQKLISELGLDADDVTGEDVADICAAWEDGADGAFYDAVDSHLRMAAQGGDE